jgi:PAS domain S-box-containing protein
MIRVLYVDDEPNLLDIGKLYLEWTKEFSVTTAPSAADALTLLKTNKFQAIVSDYQMPGMDGIALLKHVRSQFGDIPFIIFTGKGHEDVVIEAINNAADFYLQKGADAKSQYAELVHKIRTAIERKQKGITVKEREERYRLFIDSLDDMAFLKDNQFRYLMVNRSLASWFGRTEPEILTKTDFDLMPEQNARLFHESDRLVFDADSVIITEKRAGDRIYEIHTFKVPLTDGIFGIGGYIKDITETRQMELALRINSSAIDSSINAIAFADMDARVTYVNNSFLTLWGYDTLREVLGKPVTSFWNNENEVIPVLSALRETRQWTGELCARRRDGALFDVHLSLSIIRDEKDNPLCVMASLIDITERKRAEGALLKAHKQLNLLSSITRHDILNQLMALKAYLYLSREMIDSPPVLAGYFDKEEQAAKAIEEHIAFMRDYQDLGMAAPDWHNVNVCIKKAVAELPVRDIHVEIDAKNPDVFADPLFEKVFYNLIENALLYGGAGMKTIRFFSQESDQGLTLVCEDDGKGITYEDKKKLFRKGVGTHAGLSLFLSREILGITGITITENGTPGKGARFEITVPKGGYRIRGSGGE